MVFSCPTRLISEVHVFRVMTAAMKTKPLLFVAFEAVMCAPSGDQLYLQHQPSGKTVHRELVTSNGGKMCFLVSLQMASELPLPFASRWSSKFLRIDHRTESLEIRRLDPNIRL